MKPVSPVNPKVDLPLSTFGADQPQYQPLPAFRCDDEYHTVISRWRLTWKERLRVLATGNIWLLLATFGYPIQPSMISVVLPDQLKHSDWARAALEKEKP